MQDKAVRHKCRTATHRAAVQRGFLGIFCTAFCTAYFLSKYFLAVTFCIFYILSFVFCRASAVRLHNCTEKSTVLCCFLSCSYTATTTNSPAQREYC